MPELPEVETIVNRLRPVLVGQMIASVEVIREQNWLGFERSVEGKQIISVQRRAKQLSINLEGELCILIHLKMTGQLIFQDVKQHRVGGGHPTEDFVGKLPSEFTRWIIDLNDGSKLFFNDQRTFGWAKVLTVVERDELWSNLSIDLTDPKLDRDTFITLFSKQNRPIKVALLSGDLVSGVGNIYTNDALWVAKIDPRRPAASLSQEELSRLFDATLLVINDGIRLGGATMAHFRTPEGLTGHYQNIRRVYAREDLPCLICSTPIIRFKQFGRSTFYCPACQK